MPKAVTVQQLCQQIDQTIAGAFDGEVWVRGAISGISRSANGHVYFDLVDPPDPDLGSTQRQNEVSLPVALFAKSKFRVNAILKRTNSVRMTDGVEVQIRGRVTYYPRQSRVQLIMTLIDPAFTLGQLESAKAQLLAELAEAGLLEMNKRLRIPVLPLRVALITSSGSAAEADFSHELATSNYTFALTLFDSRVQGDEAVTGLTKALVQAGQVNHDNFDVIVLIRGGGARTDLAAFDHGDVARAIAASKVPVVVGVGHETDRSVADEVANTSAKTPTASAGVLVNAVQYFERRVNICSDRIAHRANDHLRQADLVVGSYRSRVGRSAQESLASAAAKLDRLSDRTLGATALGLERADAMLERADLRMRALDPQQALARGWSITRLVNPATGIIRSLDQIDSGAVLETTLAHGTITSVVTAVDASADGAASSDRPTKSSRPGESQT